MKLEEKIHQARPWRVHAIAPDFELLDVWAFDLGDGAGGLDEFLPCLWAAAAGIGESWLARLRIWLGRALGWDDHELTKPIPGCREASVSARLTAGDHAANRAAPAAPSPLEGVTVKTVYVLRDEALYEISNDTVHALLHVGVSARGSASLAVYIKSRGLGTRLYMALISPFRHALIYPALVARVEAAWRRRGEADRASQVDPLPS